MTDADTPKFAVHDPKIGDDHALAIGKIAIAWNLLQEHLGALFAGLFQSGDYTLALASWHSLVNDAAQREMLRAAAEVKLGPQSKAYKEINWVLEQIKQQIANQRNTGLHMPLMFYTNISQADSRTQILPLNLFGNRRAKAMQGKDLLKEFEHYEKQIRLLNNHVLAIGSNISRQRGGHPEAWPERPQLQPHAPK